MNTSETNDKVVYAVLIAIVIALITYGLYNKGVFDKYIKKQKKKVETTEKVKVSNEEKKESLTTEEQEDISIKVSEILSFGTNQNAKSSITFSLMNYFMDENKTYAENVEAGKLYTVLHSFDTIDNMKFSEIKEEDVKTLPAVVKNYGTEATQIDASVIETRYNELFGDDILNTNISGCPSYYYDATNLKYYSVSQCGGTAYPIILVHKDSYTKEKNTVTVELSIASYEIIEHKLYKGVISNASDNAEVNDNLLYEKEINYSYNDQSDILDEINNNYKKFEKYKMTFKKDSKGNYIYDSLKKI